MTWRRDETGALIAPSVKLGGPVPIALRADGRVEADFAVAGARTFAARVAEQGGLRVRFPRAPACEAVLINTGGGLVGGDRATYRFQAASGAVATLTTQAAEKVYRAQARDEPVEVAVHIELAPGSRLDWLPQETILFEGAALRRRLDVDIAADAELTLLESTIFGRLARGEHAVAVVLDDQWRIRRDGRLVCAEAVRLDGAATLDRTACGNGARAIATMVHIAPDAEAALERVRAALAPFAPEAAVSAWNDLLVGRFLSRSPERGRAAIVAALAALRGRALPRVWT